MPRHARGKRPVRKYVKLLFEFCAGALAFALRELRAWKQKLIQKIQRSGVGRMQAIARQFDFKAAARRHHHDAELLRNEGRGANAGQLYGFAAECGLKALMVAHGLPTEPSGDIRKRPRGNFRKHMPDLGQAVATITLFPDGRAATRYVSMLPDLSHFNDWSVDHRYWMEAMLPSGSLQNWHAAALQVSAMLDAATADGVMV